MLTSRRDLTLEGGNWLTLRLGLQTLEDQLAKPSPEWDEFEVERTEVDNFKRDLTLKAGVYSRGSQMNN